MREKMIITDTHESRALDLESIINSSLRHPFEAIKAVMSLPYLQERFERRELVGSLEERGYYDADTKKAVLIALDLASRIHKDEYRKLGIVYSSLLEKVARPSEVLTYLFKHPVNVGLDFLSGKFLRIYLSHPRAVAGDLIKMRADFSTITAAIFHDTVESLLKMNPGKTKEECLDYVISCYTGMMCSAWSTDCYGDILGDVKRQKEFENTFLSQVEDVRDVASVLTRDRTIDYLEYLFGISQLPDLENSLKAFAIKFVDRYKNALENRGHSYEDIIKAGFKNTLLVNVALLFAKEKGFYDDVKGILKGRAAKDPNMTLFGFLLMDLIEETRTTQYTNITAKLKETAGTLGDHISSARYQSIDDELRTYRKTGGFKSITQTSPAIRDHGTLLRLAADMRKAVPMAPTVYDFYGQHGREEGQRQYHYVMYRYSRILQEILTDLKDEDVKGPIRGFDMLRIDSPAYKRFIATRGELGIA